MEPSVSQWRKLCHTVVWLDLVIRFLSLIWLVVGARLIGSTCIGGSVPQIFLFVCIIYMTISGFVFFVLTTGTVLVLISVTDAFVLMNATNRWLRCQLWILAETVVCFCFIPLHMGILVLIAVRIGMLYVGIKRVMELESSVRQPVGQDEDQRV